VLNSGYNRVMTNRTLRFSHASLIALALLWYPVNSSVAQDGAENLVLVTLDGVRWQEVFGGVDMELIEDERFTNEPEFLTQTYWREQRSERRRALFPFLSSVIEDEGTLIGDRDQESYIEVTNSRWFSYPGYNEILTGKADPRIDSNAKIWNRNVTILETLNELDGFHDRVLAFGSWDVFPYIINSQRSGVPVNAGFATASNAATPESQFLNELSAEAPRLWSTVRTDFLTNGYAMDALKSHNPRVIYIAYGETDDFAHDGNYDRYIDAAHRSDLMLSKLWQWVQSTPSYRDRTTLIISTDHGRGSTPDSWQSHSNAAAQDRQDVESAPDGLQESDQIWLAAIGPCIKPAGLVKGHWKQSQIAATALLCLRLDPTRLMPEADSAITQILN
jgi:hypothetical protein